VRGKFAEDSSRARRETRGPEDGGPFFRGDGPVRKSRVALRSGAAVGRHRPLAGEPWWDVLEPAVTLGPRGRPCTDGAPRWRALAFSPRAEMRESPDASVETCAVRPGGIPHAGAVGLAVGGVLLLQIALSWGRLGLPFLDGRLHYNYDNALFATCARTGILLGDARSQMGITQVHYNAWGRPAGAPSYYTHHPFLFKAVFQLWVRGFGDSEFSTRVFALLVSMLAAAGAVVALAIATGSALAAGLAMAVMVATPVFATFELCIKYELDGMAIGTWLLAMVFLYLKRPSRGALAALFVLAVLAPLAHWTAIILVAALIVWLTGERVVAGARDAGPPLFALTLGAGIGGVILLAVFAWLKGGWAPFLRDQVAVFRVHEDVSALQPGEWGQRQRAYVALNYTWALLGLAGFLAAAHGVAWVARRVRHAPSHGAGSGRMLAAGFFSTLATAVVWVFGFAHASFIHYYMQIWLGLPIAVLFAATIRTLGVTLARTAIVGAATVVLIAWLFKASTVLTHQVIDEQVGTSENVAFLRSLRTDRFDRFVFIPTVEDPRNLWFSGPNFEYYTARSVIRFDPSIALEAGDKVLLLRSEGNAGMLTRLDALLGVRLVNETCGGAVCAYDVIRP